MTNEEKIQQIMAEATEQIMAVLKGDSITLSKMAENIDATANKIMADAFSAKTLLVDENNIDRDRYGMLDYIPENAIEELYESCKNWCTTGEFEENSKYKRFCEDMAKLSGTDISEELSKNIEIIIYKYKQINVNNTGPSNGEITT